MSVLPQIAFQTARSVLPAIDQTFDHHVMVIDSTAETSEQLQDRIERLKNPKRYKYESRKDCGVVTVVNLTWEPAKAGSVPPSLTKSFGMEFSGSFAILFNQSAHAIRKGRWAVVTSRGTAIILSGIRPEQRPENPADFPPCVIGDMTYADAEEYVSDANGQRLAIARVPRHWTIALRRADSVDESKPETEGGDE